MCIEWDANQKALSCCSITQCAFTEAAAAVLPLCGHEQVLGDVLHCVQEDGRVSDTVSDEEVFTQRLAVSAASAAAIMKMKRCG